MNVETTWWRCRYFLTLFDDASPELGAAARLWFPPMDDEDWKLGRRTSGGHARSAVWRTVTLPPDGWLSLSRLMQRDVFGPRGGARDKVSPMKLRACQEVTGAVNMRRRHPAIHGRAVAGPHSEVVTAWVSTHPDDAMRAFIADDYPLEVHDGKIHHRELKVLVPRYEKGITRWLPGDVPAGVERRLEEPGEHLFFSVLPDDV